MSSLTPQVTGAFSLVTSTTTSKAIDISRQELVTVVFTCANHTSGNGVFSIDASNDGVNWATSIAFLDGVGTTSTTLITSKTLSSNTSASAILPQGYQFIRVVVTVSTDGNYSAVVFAK